MVRSGKIETKLSGCISVFDSGGGGELGGIVRYIFGCVVLGLMVSAVGCGPERVTPERVGVDHSLRHLNSSDRPAVMHGSHDGRQVWIMYHEGDRPRVVHCDIEREPHKCMFLAPY